MADHDLNVSLELILERNAILLEYGNKDAMTFMHGLLVSLLGILQNLRKENLKMALCYSLSQIAMA